MRNRRQEKKKWKRPERMQENIHDYAQSTLSFASSFFSSLVVARLVNERFVFLLLCFQYVREESKKKEKDFFQS